jgi:hypothetical protein
MGLRNSPVKGQGKELSLPEGQLWLLLHMRKKQSLSLLERILRSRTVPASRRRVQPW